MCAVFSVLECLKESAARYCAESVEVVGLMGYKPHLITRTGFLATDGAIDQCCCPPLVVEYSTVWLFSDALQTTVTDVVSVGESVSHSFSSLLQNAILLHLYSVNNKKKTGNNSFR